MVDNNDAQFREVNEELRREQFLKLWNRYGTYIVGAAAAIVALIVGAQIWESRRLAKANEAGAAFESAADLAKSGKLEDAAKAFSGVATTGPGGYATLASLAEAGALLKSDKRSEALAIFDKVIADSGADPLLQDFARVQAASLRLGEADFTEMENRLKPLTGDANAWRFIGRELLGTAAIKAGKLDEARTTLAPLLADPNLTRTASERINRLMADIASAELATKAPQPAAAPAPAASTAPTAPAPAAETAPAAPPAEAKKDTEKPAPAR
jgi:hypothetical protein